MGVQRFTGANSREAMHKVRLALGEDALILSSQSIAEGVEILALAEDCPAPLPALDAPAPVSPRHALAAYASQAPATTRPTAPAAMPNTTDFSALGQQLLGEMAQMRALLERPAQAAAGEQRPDALAAQLLQCGFSHGLAGQLAEAARQQHGDAEPAARQAWLHSQLALRLPVLADESRLLDEAGVIALIGPTGVGKTTTTAKLAARFVMRHGAEGLALVTTDNFRIGAHEQLRIYARLLGGEVHALGPEDALEGLLEQLAGKRLVIIDTVGMSQRDQRLLTQINQLGRIGRPLRLMLVLNAASQGDTLEEVVDSYSRAALATGRPLRDCIVSKCDEAPRMGPVLDVLVRHGLRLNYLSTGQQVPEDLHLVDLPSLVQPALSPARPSLYAATQVPGRGQRLDGLGSNLIGQGRLLEQARHGLQRHIGDFVLLESAWRLAGLPVSAQAGELARLLAANPPLPGAASEMLWGGERPVVGATWKMPALAFDSAGALQIRPWLAHQLPIGQQQCLSWSSTQLGARRHLWLGCPSREGLQRLQESAQPWLAVANRNQRVVHGQATASLAQLVTYATLLASEPLRQRGRWVGMEISYLPVCLPGHPDTALRAWFGTLRDPDTGASLGQRYWLADAAQPDPAMQAASLCRLQACEGLPALALRAWNILGERQGQMQAELRLFLATALAATACQLDQAGEAWATSLRLQLLELIGKRRNPSPVLLLDGLLNLLLVGEVFQRLAATQQRALA